MGPDTLVGNGSQRAVVTPGNQCWPRCPDSAQQGRPAQEVPTQAAMLLCEEADLVPAPRGLLVHHLTLVLTDDLTGLCNASHKPNNYPEALRLHVAIMSSLATQIAWAGISPRKNRPRNLHL